MTYANLGHNGSGAKRKVHSTKCLRKEIGEISYYNLTAHLKALEQKKQAKPRRVDGRNNQTQC